MRGFVDGPGPKYPQGWVDLTSLYSSPVMVEDRYPFWGTHHRLYGLSILHAVGKMLSFASTRTSDFQP